MSHEAEVRSCQNTTNIRKVFKIIIVGSGECMGHYAGRLRGFAIWKSLRSTAVGRKSSPSGPRRIIHLPPSVPLFASPCTREDTNKKKKIQYFLHQRNDLGIVFRHWTKQVSFFPCSQDSPLCSRSISWCSMASWIHVVCVCVRARARALQWVLVILCQLLHSVPRGEGGERPAGVCESAFLLSW